ncbi:MAG TPA: DUF6701 domain-containing protein [Burkholderiales bacterium]|nr:DUF6701 domain-containing protein [Burkholderiales bacterium]
MRFVLVALLMAATPAFGALITITANTNWSAIATGTGPGGQPGAGDTILVKNGRTLTVNVATAVVGAITLGGGNPSGGQGTLSFNAGSALTLTSSGGHTGLLTLGGGGQAGNLNMNSGGTLTLNGFTSTTVGTFTRGSGTIVLTGTNTLPTAAAYATYTNLSVSANTTTLGQNTTVAGNLNIIGGTLNTSTRTLSVTGTSNVGGTLTLTNTTTLTGATTIGGTLNITSATGNKTFGAVTISTGGTWNSTVAGNVFLQGNFANNGTFTSNLATYTFNGAAAQTFTGTNAGSTSFAFLTLNNANGLTLIGTHDLQVGTLLTMAAGKIVTGANHVYVSNGSNISGAATGRFIEGNLRKPFSSGNLSRIFEVGGNAGTNYSPASITFASVSTSGDVTVSTTSGQHPQIASSGLDDTTPALLNRYWTLTNNGVAFTSYGASFSYAASEIDAGASASTFLAVRYASPSWNPTTLNGTPTTTTLLITGETGFGEFAIGNTGASSGTIGRFNAYDPPPVTPSGSVTGNIRTKIAGTLFTLTIVHLDNKGTGTQNMNDNITVDLLDGSPTGGTMTNNCSSNWTTVIASVGGNISGGNFSTTVNFTVANSWRDVRVKVTRAGGGEIGCSTDNFAIRPAFINVVASDGTWQTAGTTRVLDPTTGRVHAASTTGAATPRPFTLALTAVNSSSVQASNYAGTATLKSGSPACTPASCTTGTLSPTTFPFSGGAFTTNNAHYSEAGNFHLEVEDASFADVDTADTAASVRTIPQGGTPPLLVGRFVPDRFVFSGANTPQLRTFGNTCGGRSFTYVGQPFWFVTGLAPSATFSAVNAGGGVTTNYTLDTAASRPAVTETYADAGAPAGAPLNTSGTVAFTANVAGTTTYQPPAGTLSYTRNATTPVAPFNAAITLSVTALDATQTNVENGTVNITGSVVFNSGPSAIAFDSGNQVRYGVVRLADVFAPAAGNASGKAPVGIEAQYWNGAGFVTNAADNCTSFVEKNFVLYGHGGAVTSANVATPTAGSNGALTMGVGTLAGGLGRVEVSAPSPAIGSPGNVRICLDADPSSGPVDADCAAVTPADRGYLQGRWAGTGSYNKDPTATVGFGVFGAQPRNFIYFRENY